METHITLSSVIDAILLYGIVHAVWTFLKFIYRFTLGRTQAEIRRHRNQIIHTHVEAGHEGRLRDCTNGDCLRLQTPVVVPGFRDSLQELLLGAHTE